VERVVFLVERPSHCPGYQLDVGRLEGSRYQQEVARSLPHDGLGLASATPEANERTQLATHVPSPHRPAESSNTLAYPTAGGHPSGLGARMYLDGGPGSG